MSILEWRHYTAVDGRGDEVERRFRDHTFDLFRDHGIGVLTFGRDAEEPDHFHYVVGWADRDAMDAAWAAFAADDRWKQVRDASEADGAIVARIDRRILTVVPH
jgi:hypothetical protein